MAKAIDYLGPGESLGQRELKRIAKAHCGEGIPSYSTVTRYVALTTGASWDKWVKAAYALHAAGTA
jgi:hypothetical protein